MDEGIAQGRIDLDTRERFVPLRRQLGVSGFGLNQITLQPGQRGRVHRHERQEEVYLVLEGTLTLMLADGELELGQGELVRVAPSLRRQLVNRGPARMTLLALGGSAEHEGRDGEAFASWQDETGGPPQEIPLPTDLDAGEIRSTAHG